MRCDESITSSEDDRPVYFKPFSRESLEVIKKRKAEEEMRKKEEERKRAEERFDEDEDDGPRPDEKLEQGATLPIRMAAAFEEEMAIMPLEDFDPFYSTIPTFVIVTRKKDIFRFSAHNALGILSPFNPIRRVAIAILTHGLFSLFIITTIMFNCYVMIIPTSPVTESTEVIFTAIYTFESAVKLVARGFILEKFTYLRDAWNWLDFVVISFAYVTMAIDLGNLAALRTFRVFRALKTVAIIPGLKTIVNAVIESVKNLRDVIILTFFGLSVFALIGLQIYMGVLTQKCIRDFEDDGSEGEERDINWHNWNLNLTNWYPFPPPDEYGNADYPLCGNSSGAGPCPDNYTCRQGYGPNPNYGYTSFDTFGSAFLSSFRLMTQDFWESLYQQVLRTAGPWHMLFFIVIIFLGSYYLVNLILAIVAMSYDELQRQAELEEMAEAAEREALIEEEAARQAKKEARENRATERAAAAAAAADGGDHGAHDPPKSPSQFSSRSYETWAEDQGGDGVKGVKSEFNVSYAGSHAKLGGISKRNVDASVSLPGTPFNNRRSSQPLGQEKLMILSTYIDAQEHLPYADDSTAATPMSEENGAILLPFCNGLHPTHPLQNFALGSRYSSYNSHASRFSYTSHDMGGGRHGHSHGPGCGFGQPVTKEHQLIQRARNLYGDGCKHDCEDAEVMDETGKGKPGEREGVYSGDHLHPGSTGVDMRDVMDLNELIEQAGRTSRLSHASGGEERERPTLKELIKKAIVSGCLRCIDIFCLWDCGFPWSLFKRAVSFVVFDAFTELFITLAIMVNTVFMALDHYGLEEKPLMQLTLKAGNKVFTTIFTVESSMKIIAMSPKFFFQVGWNVFDFIIVAFSLIELIFEDANLPGIGALRSFRLLRVFKLAKSWPALNMILTIMGKTVGALSNLTFVLVMIIFIFAVMGMQLFAQDYFEKTYKFPGGELPRWNFTDFGHSFLIVFRVLCGEWIESMWDCILVAGPACVPFFLAVVVVGYLVILNLFLALLLSSFGASSLSPSTDNETNKIAEAFDRFGRFFAWVKAGIRKFFQYIEERLIQAKNRIVPNSSQNQQMDEQAAAAAAKADAASRRKRPRMAEKARLVMNSKRLMETLAKAKEEDGDVTKTEPDTMSMKSYGSHTIPREAAIRKKKREEGDGSGSDYDDDEIRNMSQEDDNWIEDEEIDDADEGQELHVRQREEEEYPADCMPPRFYERFPIFDVDDTPFGDSWSNIRLKTYRLIENKYFELFLTVAILLSSLAMAFEDINLPKKPLLTDILFHMDKIFSVIFLIEMLIKWLALGFAAFFSNAWCWLDFVIVMVSVIDFIAAMAGAGSVPAFKTMKTLRALRPLKAMAKMQGMRIVVNALVQSVPSIINVLLVVMIFWLIFAIMGVQLFNGKFHKCLDPEDESRPDYRIIRNKVECLANNFTWENSVMNFDHVGKAYLSLFQVATFKGWIGIMNDAIDSREIDEQPHRETSFVMYIYFVIFIVFGSFFNLNLLVGVIIDNFNEQKKKSGGSVELFMTEDQKKYYAAMQKMGGKKPIKAKPKPTWKPQLMVFDFVMNQKFDMVIMLFIGMNMITMMMDHYQMNKAWDENLALVNSIFVAIFTAECCLKMFALRHHYFTEPWNLFDFVVVFLSIAGLVLSDLIEKYFVSPTLLRVVRVAKVGRVLRLVKGAKGIRTLLFALAMSLPALFNICLLLFLVMFIFSIFGMSFFMNVKLRGALDSVYNFQTFGQSIILLFQISTSAGWDGVLDGIINEDECELPDPEVGKAGDCGNATVGIAFMLSYLVMSFLIIINMYIAVILENYSQATEDVQEGVTDEDYEMYYEIWAQFDPDGTQYIRYDQLSDLIDLIDPPLQIPKPNKYKIISMDLPICKGDMIYCVDILDALTKDFFARKGNPIDDPVDITEVTVSLNRAGYEPVSSTLWRQREEYCARLIQTAWRRRRSMKLGGGVSPAPPTHQPNTDGEDKNDEQKGEEDLVASVVVGEEGGHAVLIDNAHSTYPSTTV